MLVGCAFENALKGILVGRHPELVTEDGQITGKLKHHVLLQLFRDCGFSPSTEDVATLETLAQHVVWRGRYPIPVKAENMQTQSGADGALKSPIDSLTERIFAELLREHAKQKASTHDIFDAAQQLALKQVPLQ